MLMTVALAMLAAAAQPRPQPTPDPGYGRELPDGAANLDFVALNRTGRTITGLQIRPTGEGAPWSDDVLVPRDLPAGERGAATYTRDIELCRWDVRATFERGQPRIWPRIDLCSTVRVELR